jgi:hypothetical protein
MRTEQALPQPFPGTEKKQVSRFQGFKKPILKTDRFRPGVEPHREIRRTVLDATLLSDAEGEKSCYGIQNTVVAGHTLAMEYMPEYTATCCRPTNFATCIGDLPAKLPAAATVPHDHAQSASRSSPDYPRTSCCWRL